jgi:hypothetical protein
MFSMSESKDKSLRNIFVLCVEKYVTGTYWLKRTPTYDIWTQSAPADTVNIMLFSNGEPGNETSYSCTASSLTALSSDVLPNNRWPLTNMSHSWGLFLLK